MIVQMFAKAHEDSGCGDWHFIVTDRILIQYLWYAIDRIDRVPHPFNI